MPLLEITNSRKVTTTVSLEESTANLVNQYGRAWDLWKEKVGKID